MSRFVDQFRYILQGVSTHILLRETETTISFDEAPIENDSFHREHDTCIPVMGLLVNLDCLL